MVCVPSLAPTPVPFGPVHGWDRCVLTLRMLWGGVGWVHTASRAHVPDTSAVHIAKATACRAHDVRVLPAVLGDRHFEQWGL